MMMTIQMIKTKICGIKSIDAARSVEKFGGDFIGFIFYPKSHRYIDPRDAKKIIDSLNRKSKIVGVFVDEDPDKINSIARDLNLDFIQLHGNESAQYARQIEFPIIKAWRINDNFDIERANQFPCEIALLDTFVKGSAGGTGKSFDWENLELDGFNKDFLIAGGISIENVDRAVEIFQKSDRFIGVDVSGSLEIDYQKSPDLIQKFLEHFNSLRK